MDVLYEITESKSLARRTYARRTDARQTLTHTTLARMTLARTLTLNIVHCGHISYRQLFGRHLSGGKLSSRQVVVTRNNSVP